MYGIDMDLNEGFLWCGSLWQPLSPCAMLDAPVMKRRDLKQKMATDGQEKMDARVCCAAAKPDYRVILV